MRGAASAETAAASAAVGVDARFCGVCPDEHIIPLIKGRFLIADVIGRRQRFGELIPALDDRNGDQCRQSCSNRTDDQADAVIESVGKGQRFAADKLSVLFIVVKPF